MRENFHRRAQLSVRFKELACTWVVEYPPEALFNGMSRAKDCRLITAENSVEIVVNGQPTTTAVATLDQLLLDHGYGEVRVATALNGEFVPERLRSTTRLSGGDRIEIVSPRQGG
jgi:sulfur carrier protein